MSRIPVYHVIGHPVGHSMSPFIHERLFRLRGREAAYTALDLPPERLGERLPALLREAEGLNVTIPHKRAVIPFLDGLRGPAGQYRSVNTIAVRPEGCFGYNTDAGGFLNALRDGGVPLTGRVALLGCGGVGRTFACEAAKAGCEIVNAVRDSGRSKADELRRFVRKLVPDAPYTIVPIGELSGDFDLLINATPVGMYPHGDACPVERAAVARTAAVFDAIYNPGDTRLLRYARAQGARTVGGMPMLVWQAAIAHEIWYGARFDPQEIAQLTADASREMRRLFGGGSR